MCKNQAQLCPPFKMHSVAVMMLREMTKGSVCMSMYHFMVCAEEQTNLVGECVAGETSG
eukprot:m.61752 g.61752  ORF g.61752 m.61752 type:complete len:59 (+) comp17603_c0_seq1:443-619(+)